MTKCPYCGTEIDFQDEFTSFEDEGDCITGTAFYLCECGEVLTVKAVFTWNGEVEVK